MTRLRQAESSVWRIRVTVLPSEERTPSEAAKIFAASSPHLRLKKCGKDAVFSSKTAWGVERASWVQVALTKLRVTSHQPICEDSGFISADPYL